jgi:drug/metabolite transporter (DMT)-like permease
MTDKTPINRHMSGGEWLSLLLLSALWGGSFFFSGVLIKTLPPFTIVLLRVGLAALILNVLVRALGLRMPGGIRAWRAFFAMGLLNNAIPFCLIVWGQTHIASGLAAILNATTPISAVIVAHLLTPDEKMTGNRLLGVVIGFFGVVILIGPDSLQGLGTDILAQVAVLMAAVSYAFAGVYGRRFKAMGIDPILTATGQVTASTLLLLPVAMLVDRPWTLAMPPSTAGFWCWSVAAGPPRGSDALAYSQPALSGRSMARSSGHAIDRYAMVGKSVCSRSWRGREMNRMIPPLMKIPPLPRWRSGRSAPAISDTRSCCLPLQRFVMAG